LCCKLCTVPGSRFVLQVVHSRGQSVGAASCAQYWAVGLCCKLCTVPGSRFVLQIVHSRGQSVCAASCAQYRAVGLCYKLCTVGGSRFVLQVVHSNEQLPPEASDSAGYQSRNIATFYRDLHSCLPVSTSCLVPPYCSVLSFQFIQLPIH